MSRPLRRRSLIVPWAQKPKPVIAGRKGVASDIDPALRELVYRRAGGRCEACGDPLVKGQGVRGWHAHHRKLKSRGGQDSASNLAALCSYCHRRMHGHSHFATEHGFIVSAYDDPATTPMRVGLGDVDFYLRPDGTYQRADEGVA